MNPFRRFASIDRMRLVAWAAPAIFLVHATAVAAEPAPVEPVAIESELRDGVGRIVFTWPAPVGFTAVVENDQLRLRFDRPLAADLSALRTLAPLAVEPARSADGRTLSMALRPGVAVVGAPVGRRILVQLSPRTPEARDSARRRAGEAVETATAAPVRPAQAAKPEPAPPPAAQPPAAQTVPSPAADPVLRFDWREPAQAAVFTRGDVLWVVFDRPSAAPLEALRAAAGDAAYAVEQSSHPTATVVRVRLARPARPRVSRDGLAWAVQLGGARTVDGDPIVPTPGDAGGPQARLTLAITSPSQPVRITDPAVGDELLVAPTGPIGRGVPFGWAYPQFNLLPTIHGVVAQALSEAVSMRSTAVGVEISAEGGLLISPKRVGDEAAPLLRLDRAASVLFRPEDWPPEPTGGIAAATRVAAMAPPAERTAAQASMALLYLARGMAAEAIGTAEEAARLAGGVAHLEPKLRFALGIGRTLMDRGAEAAEVLADPALATTDEGRMWLELARAADPEAGVPAEAAFDAWTTIAGGYPQPLRRATNLRLLDAAAAQAPHHVTARRIVAALRSERPSAVDAAWLDYQDGRLRRAAGDADGAISSWDRAIAGVSEAARARAVFDRAELLLDAGRIEPAEAIDALDRLRMTWRGDELEFRALDRLAQLQANDGRILEALRTWRDAASRFHDRPGTGEVARKMAALFETTFRDGAAERMPPWRAAALFDEFSELTPIQPDAAAAVLRAYARTLAAAELPGRAAATIETLSSAHGASGAVAAESRLDLAQYLVRDGRSDSALAVLRRADAGAPSPALARSQRLIEAEALLALARRDEALALVAGDSDDGAERLRLKAATAESDWAGVATALRRRLDNAPADLPSERRAIGIELAAALTLAGDRDGIDRLAGEHARAFEGRPEAEAFRLLTERERPIAAERGVVRSAVADARALADFAAAAGR